MHMSFRLAAFLFLIVSWVPRTVPAEAHPPAYVVLFTHIEDAVPGGTLGSPQSRQNYMLYRSRLIQMALLARDYAVPWSLQPDWKIMEAALLYEDSTLTTTTNDKNFLRFLKEDLGVIIDPHSHENLGYNYPDVAHLLDSLGVGTTTVIGGHVWDPDLDEFAEWDRFREPVAGEHYPWALWRGDILMGSGTPFHVNDPKVTGVWRPRDRYHYFEHDSTANIVAIGQYKGTITDLPELVNLYETGAVATQYMLTSTYAIRPATIIAPGGIPAIEDTIIVPIVALRDSGIIVPTNFTSIVETWLTSFGGRGHLYDPEAVSGVPQNVNIPVPDVLLGNASPNPFSTGTVIQYTVSRETRVRIAIFDVSGRELHRLVDEVRTPGRYDATWNTPGLASGTYFCRILEGAGDTGGSEEARKLVFLRGR